MNKAHCAEWLAYTSATGFAHMHSQEKCIWVNMKFGPGGRVGPRAPSRKLDE